jgi:rifampicin phosphotransferase
MKAAKFTNLRQAAEVASVPTTIFLDDVFFAELIDDYVGVDRQIEAVLAEMVLTSGAVLDRQIERLDQILSGLKTTAHAAQLIAGALAPLMPDWAVQPLAIRSAARDEDQAHRSGAGLYLSVLDVIGSEAIGGALLAVWQSYFSRAALVGRLAGGRLTNRVRMTAMVQSMVPAAAAGVAFSLDPVTGAAPGLCEYIAGLADRLVSGAESGRRLRLDEAPKEENDPLGMAGAQAVFATLARLRQHFAQEIDVEWVWDGCEIHVVQVRPISTHTGEVARRSLTPTFEAVGLYDAEDGELDDFAPIPEFVSYFRAKRRPLRLLARSLGFRCPPALLVRYNRQGLDEAQAERKLAEMAGSGTVVIDASERVRQMLARGADLINTLRVLSADPHFVHVVTLRAFVTGDIGFITQPRTDGRIALEYSRDGLLALNRGTADADITIMAPDGSGRPEWLDERGARQIAQAVAAVALKFGPVQVEWIRDRDSLIMVDHSRLSSAFDGHPSVIGHGFAHAPVIRLNDSAALGDLSEGPSVSVSAVPGADSLGSYMRDQLRRVEKVGVPPILVCRKPYALLAALIPHVSGFIFESAPLLSHLSILIRESHKPALASPDLFARLSEGTWFMLDLPASKGGDVPEFTP